VSGDQELNKETGAALGPGLADDRASEVSMRCRCVWRGEQCANKMTQEDGLCNWCGNGRSEAQLRTDPKAFIGSNGEFFGISGAGQLHDSDARKPATTAACWYPDSDRQVRPIAQSSACVPADGEAQQ
jgi:hypothetical protein